MVCKSVLSFFTYTFNFEGQQDDSRMNVALALTAVWQGATIANYTEVLDLIKDEDSKVVGALVKDKLNGEIIKIKAKGVINATGPFTGKTFLNFANHVFHCRSYTKNG